MKTKFILHGGMTSKDSPHNDSFFAEFSKDLKSGSKVMYVGFARESDEEQEEVFERDRAAILAQTDKTLVIEKAELDTFEAQLQQADAVYVTGGKTKLLKERLLTCPNFVDLLKGKTYAGSSAGANVVSTFHTNDFAAGIQEGLGMVPVKTMTHYGNAAFNAAKENVKWFDKYPQDLELVLLTECEWVVKEIEL